MTRAQAALKRAFDVVVAFFGLLATCWLILIGWIVARISTGDSGFFRQRRIGRDGRPFRILKLRTMRNGGDAETTCTSASDPRITRGGRWLRSTKLDELPQLWNVLVGDMSIVGPRPDVPGFADLLEGEERALLTLRPGITGPASLAFLDEERLLDEAADPERYNREVLWPRKVELNLQYLRDYSFRRDLGYVLATFLPPLRRRLLSSTQPSTP